MAPTFHEVYVCPSCRVKLAIGVGSLSCAVCDRRYPLDDGIADFVRGSYYDTFTPGEPRSRESQIGLDHELTGAEGRIFDFYLPRIERQRRAVPKDDFYVLDCGCGNGLSIDLLNDSGISAWGNDPSALRKWQWRQRRWKNRLFVADGESLPIADGFFDVVLASGVLEHIGVVESRSDHYEVRPLPSRDGDRRRFLSELLRVTAPGGTIWLDFPNGFFPIDFWHGESPGAARLHGPREGFLPTAREVRGYLERLPFPTTVRFHSPFRRLQFRQVRKHWYGKILFLPADVFLRLMTLLPFRALGSSPLNPFLIVEVRRSNAA